MALAHPNVEVGSYPRFDNADYKVKITFESKDANEVAGAMKALLAALPRSAVVRSEGP